MHVLDALNSRMSCRAFRSDPVPEETVSAILEAASRAPSGGNLQPWQVFAVTGAPLQAIIEAVKQKLGELPRGEVTEYHVYPPELKEPYAHRRFRSGEVLYREIEIPREDRAGRGRQFRKNFELFGAPVGLFIYLDRTMGPPQWADCGMFLQSLMLAARAFGLHTCAQEAWAQWHGLLAGHLAPPPEWMLFCGVALGVMDETAPINRVRTERAAVEEFCAFKGF